MIYFEKNRKLQEIFGLQSFIYKDIYIYILAVPAASLALNLTKKDLLRYTVGSVFQVTGNSAFSATNNYNPHNKSAIFSN